MEILPVYLFKDSFGPFLTLLNEHQVKYQMREVRSGILMAMPGVVEIIQAVGNVAMWGALATVLVTFIKSRYGRKVMITTKDNRILQACEGLSPKELEQVLEYAKSLSITDLNKHQDEESPTRSQ